MSKMLGSQVHRKVRAEDVPRSGKAFKVFRRRQKKRERRLLTGEQLTQEVQELSELPFSEIDKILGVNSGIDLTPMDWRRWRNF